MQLKSVTSHPLLRQHWRTWSACRRSALCYRFIKLSSRSINFWLAMSVTDSVWLCCLWDRERHCGIDLTERHLKKSYPAFFFLWEKISTLCIAAKNVKHMLAALPIRGLTERKWISADCKMFVLLAGKLENLENTPRTQLTSGDFKLNFLMLQCR